MNYLSVVLIAIALAMDAFAVSVCGGMSIPDIQVKHRLKIALCFGVFQMIMPILGWLAGISFSTRILGYDHWVAFGLLAFVGVHMIYESFEEENCATQRNMLDNHVLLVLGIATSIDALAVGITFSLLHSPIIIPSLIIGIITFLICIAGIFLGKGSGGYSAAMLE